MFRKCVFLVFWNLVFGLSIVLTCNVQGQEASPKKLASAEDVKLLTKQSIEFLTKTVKNGKIDFRFKTPDREGGPKMASGSKIPQFVAPEQVFTVEGAFKVTGDWENVKSLRGRRIQMEVSIQAIPVFNILDDRTREKVKEDRKFDWEYWKFDEADAGSNSEEETAPKSIPKPDGERNIMIDFTLNSKNGKIEYTGPFVFQWQSTEKWTPGTYYKVVAASNDGLCVTTRAGVFSGIIESVSPTKRLSRIAFYMLSLLGYEPDPFYWSK